MEVIVERDDGDDLLLYVDPTASVRDLRLAIDSEVQFAPATPRMRPPEPLADRVGAGVEQVTEAYEVRPTRVYNLKVDGNPLSDDALLADEGVLVEGRVYLYVTPEYIARRRLRESGAVMNIDVFKTAVEDGEVDVVRMVLTANILPEDYVETLLATYVWPESAEGLKTLLAAEVGAGGRPVLHDAVHRGDARKVDALLQAEYLRLDVDALERYTTYPTASNAFRYPCGWTDRLACLHIAAAESHLGCVRSLLKHGAQVSVRDAAGYTPLHHVWLRARPESETQLGIASALLAAGADVNAGGANGRTALLCACTAVGSRVHRSEAEDVKAAVVLLIDKGADVNAVSEVGRTALMEAARSGYVPVVEKLLEAGADPTLALLDVPGSHGVGRTALHSAALAGNADIIDLLLRAGANACAVDAEGLTALHDAVGGMHVAAVEALLAGGARGVIDQVAASTKPEGTALAVCMKPRTNAEKITKLLLAAGADTNICDADGRGPLYYAIRSGISGAVEMVLQHGASVHQCVKVGNSRLSPLAAAAESGCTDMVHALTCAGALPDGRDIPGASAPADGPQPISPLWVAAENGVDEAVKVLLAAGADVSERNARGQTALHGAANIGHVSTARILLAAGAAVGAVCGGGWAPQHLAAALPYDILARGVLDVLYKAGADPTATVPDGLTALHLAAGAGHVRAVERVLAAASGTAVQQHVDPTAMATPPVPAAVALVGARAGKGETALHCAVATHDHATHAAVVRTLVAAGADVDARDDAGATPLDRACRKLLECRRYAWGDHGGLRSAVWALVAAGADPRVGNTIETVTRAIAERSTGKSRMDDVVQLLREAEERLHTAEGGVAATRPSGAPDRP